MFYIIISRSNMNGIRVKNLVEDANVQRFVRYLGAFKVVEGDLGLFDELSRVKDIEQFAMVVNKFLRVKDRVLEKLIRGVRENEYVISTLSEEEEGSLSERIRRIFDVGSDAIRNIYNLAEANPRLVATVISSLALAYSGIKEVEKKSSR
mgnify:CR=1 FL=1